MLPSPHVDAEARYQRRLLVFLSVASFFEGYDFLALAQLLPNIRKTFELSPTEGGLLVTVVNAGTMIAYALVRAADRWGRKRVLSWTIAGYTLASFLSGLAPNVWLFAAAQLLSRIFLIGEWAIALVVAAEEFPADKRGSAMGMIQASTTLGAIVCAAVVPQLVKLPTGWRTIYFVGAAPLFLVMLARREMRETKRFEVQLKAVGERARSFFDILRGPYARRIVLVASVWALCYVCTQNVTTFWKEFAVAERAMSDADVGLSVTIAALGSIPLVFLSGKMLDRIGRRKSAAIIFVATAVSTAGAYNFTSHAALTGALVVAIFGTTAVLQVLNAYTAELFPTTLRADAFAWANNLLGRVGYVLSPVAVGWAAERSSWSLAVGSTAIFPLLALVVVLAKFPETRGRELEETSAA
ncbi:MAG: MFS transporter [Polyangiaceae bacterium]|nr:MFS transporter [Polyangiaceae bacterium]